MTRMHLRWNVPLPGPFSVGGRVDGRATGSVVVGLAKLMFYMTIWPVWMIAVWSVRLTWRLCMELVRGAAWAVRYVQARRARNSAPVTASAQVRAPEVRADLPEAHILSPHLAGQLDAQRDRPRPPTYSDPRDAEAYIAGWRQAAPRRPVPDVQSRR